MMRFSPAIALISACLLVPSCEQAKKLVEGAGGGGGAAASGGGGAAEQAGAAVDEGKQKLYAMYQKRVASVGPITDELVRKYIKATKLMRRRGVNLHETLASGGKLDAKKTQGSMIKAAKAAGFASLAEYVKVNAKISWAWSMAQAKVGMNRQKKLQGWAQGQLSAGEKMILDQLKNPDVPESTKAQLRQTLAQLRRNKVKLGETYKKNVKWAKVAMRFVSPLTNEADAKVLMRHEAELMAVFTGLNKTQLAQLRAATAKQLEQLEKK